MANRMVWVTLGLLILGLILLAVGAVIEPPRSNPFPTNISAAGESLIALGLTLIVISVGFFLAGSAEMMMSKA